MPKKHNPSSEGLSLTTIEHIQKLVCAPELRNQFQKASCVQKAFIIGISLLPPKVEVQFPNDSALNQVSISEILCQNWIIFIWRGVGGGDGQRQWMCFTPSPSAFEGRTLFW